MSLARIPLRGWLTALMIVAVTFLAVATHSQEAPTGASTEALTELAESYPEDPAVAYALGLSHAHAGEIGPATLYLERAHLLAPLDREASDALHIVRREARRRRAESMPGQTIMEGEPSAVFWWRFFHVVPDKVFAYGLTASVWLMFALFAVWRRMQRSGRRDAILVLGMVAGFVAANAGVFWAGAAWTMAKHEPAVIVAAEPRYVDAPDELSRPRRQTNLYEGAIAVIIEAREGWRLVELVDGERVWVSADVAVPVLP